jgi:iron complex transport system permease protein
VATTESGGEAVAPVATARLGRVAPERLRMRWIVAGVAAVLAAVVLGTALGPAGLAPQRVLLELLDRLPLVSVNSGLTPLQSAIVWDIRLPRVVLGLLVGAMLAVSGGAYQGAFRNPLADPYLLGVAAGAGLGATIAMTLRSGGPISAGSNVGLLPLAAFVGALAAVALTYALGATAGGRSASTLLLAGIAVANFFTALQTYVQQRNVETIREVFSWILGRLTTAGWRDVAVLTPYVVVSSAVLLSYRRVLDVMAVGDDEAAALGIDVRRARIIVILAASFGTAAAVAASGLIGFVGVIVPHTVRLLVGRSYRVILPLSLLFGGAFLVLADLLARMIARPAELPIGVITAFFGAPFFLVALRSYKRSLG